MNDWKFPTAALARRCGNAFALRQYLAVCNYRPVWLAAHQNDEARWSSTFNRVMQKHGAIIKALGKK